MLGMPFDVIPARVEEAREPDEDPSAYVERLARDKAAEVARQHPRRWILAGDTTVVLAGRVLEKPADDNEALDMLQTLAGREHHVMSGLALIGPDRDMSSRVDTARVRFRAFDRATALAYVATGEPSDKAGAYGIQGVGATLVESVRGDFYTVVGLSVHGLVTLLAGAGRPYGFPGAEAPVA